MPIHLNVNGSWQEGNKVYVKVAGSWVEADELFIKQAGAWASAWKNEIIFVNNSNRTAASIYALMGSPSNPGTYIFENNAVISAGTSSYALRTGSFPAGSTLLIINKGTIQGKGGNGGAYNGAGGAGGTALYIDFNCTLDNGAGYIYGGGGGGGGSWGRNATYTSNYIRAGGGGGAGRNGGSAGSAISHNTNTTGSVSNILQPAAGSASAGGRGGRIRYTWSSSSWSQVQAGAGGGQGAAGAAGSGTGNGGQGTAKGQRYTFAGGAAGKAIAKNGKAVSITAGNTSTRIKGAVS